MRTCGNCGQKKCINSVIGVESTACQDWRPRWGQRIAGIVVLVIMLIMLAIIILSAIGDHVNTGRESWELRPAGIETFRTTEIPRLVPGDPAVYLQETSAGLCEVGLQQEAVWHHNGQRVEVPTVWIHLQGNAFRRLQEEIDAKVIAGGGGL